MVRWIFIIVVFVHALIHLMGFSKAFGFASFEQLTKPISKGAGVAWFAAAFLLLAAMFLLATARPYWWMVALPAAILSQILIFTVWHDARFGTLANAALLIAGVIAAGTWFFHRQAAQHRLELQQNIQPLEAARDSSRTPLPTIVQTWLVRSGVFDRPRDRHVTLTQRGKMRTKPDGHWMAFSASQEFSIDPPAFVWQTEVNMMPGIFMLGEDRYHHGHGEMRITLLGLIPVVHSSGPEIDQGTLLRYLGESCWFPSAALSPYMEWKPIDDRRASATFTYGDVSATGTFTFNQQGDITDFEALRYGDFDGVKRLERWHISCADHKPMDGVRVPTSCVVSWKLPEGDFRWLELTLETVTRKGWE